MNLLVVVSDWTADLDGGAGVHGGGAPHLQLDGGLCGVALDEALVLLGPDLGVGHVLAGLGAAVLLGPRLAPRPAARLGLVDQLTQGQQLLAAHLAVPHPAPAPPGTLTNKRLFAYSVSRFLIAKAPFP